MSEKRHNKNINIYNIDLTLTDDCNFNCSYCFEHGHFNHNYFKDIDLFIKRMDELLNSLFFKSNYQMLGINFWGGEPTLHKKAIMKIIEYYKNNDKVKFFIYSNGFHIKSFMDLFITFREVILDGNHPKLCIQISYDGMPIQDICRKTKKNETTSCRVKNNIRMLFENKIPCVLKSTITIDTFKYLPSARLDILSLMEEFPNSKDFIRSNNYFPTIDHYNIKKFTKDELKTYYNDLYKSLVSIANDEIDYYKKHKRFFLAWFNSKKSLCSAGKDIICINWDSNVFKCHGTVYEDSLSDHYITNLNDDDFIYKIEECNKIHSINFYEEPEECKTCIASFCLRCNSVKYENSKKKEYIDRWRDYTNQPELCEFYKLNGKICLAINEIIMGDLKNGM